MNSLRATVIALGLANVLALAVWKGWLGNGLPKGEPERLENQLNAERMHLMPGAAQAPVAVAAPAPADKGATPAPAQPEAPAPLACVAFGGLNAERARDIEARAVKADGLKVSESRGDNPSSWWVHIPSLGSRDAAERKLAELQKLGVTDLFIVNDAGANQHAISLGLYKTEQGAARLLELLKGKGVRSAQILARGGSLMRVEIRGPSDVLTDFTSALTEQMQGLSRLECAP
jgi:hypothetical protein